MRSLVIVKLFLVIQCAAELFGEELVLGATKYRFFKKNLRVSVKELLERAALAQVPLPVSLGELLVRPFSETPLAGQSTIEAADLVALYQEFQDNLSTFSPQAFMSSEQLAFMLDCAPSSIYIYESFPTCVKAGIFPVARWPAKLVWEWAEASVYAPQSRRHNTKKAI